MLKNIRKFDQTLLVVIVIADLIIIVQSHRPTGVPEEGQAPADIQSIPICMGTLVPKRPDNSAQIRIGGLDIDRLPKKVVKPHRSDLWNKKSPGGLIIICSF